jgi:endonuclease I
MDFRLKIIVLFFWLPVFVADTVSAQIPPGYYDGAEGLSGEGLRSALSVIINDHIELSYASLWTHFQSTDKKPDGTVWDMYSDIPGGNPAYVYNFGVDQCGNYSGEGDCYNREHSFPKSWFNDAPPMASDLFQIYPTDGYVNGQRSNYPYGEVEPVNWTGTNGSKRGSCTFPGYNGIVFEPIDAYKGDFARTYFYMVTCYKNSVSGWSSPMLSGDNFSAWARDLLVQWHIQDPVSPKETDRNEAVYDVQENRNPFIDHPEWVGEIWGTATGIEDIIQPTVKIWFSENSVYLQQDGEMSWVLNITNLLGQSVWQYRSEGTFIRLPVKLNPGIYVATFSSPEGVFAEKLMVADR